MKKDLFLLDVTQDGKGNIILFCRDKKGKSVLVRYTGFEPHFFLLPKIGKEDEVRKLLEKKGVEFLEEKKVWKGEKRNVLKILANLPKEVKEMRDLVKNWKDVEDTFWYSESHYRKFLIENPIFPMRWISVNGERYEEKSYDVDYSIECYDIEPKKHEHTIRLKVMAFDTEFVENDRLVMLSVVTESGYKKVFTTQEFKNMPEYVEIVKGEKDIVERFMKVVKENDIDILVGYNSDGFDFPKLQEVCERYGVKMALGRDRKEARIVRRGRVRSFKINGRIHIDLYNFVSHILSPNLKSEVLTLDEVAKELLGEGKLEMSYEEMVRLWRSGEGLKKIVEYNLNDSVLTLKLSKVILPQIFSLCRLVGQTPFDISRYTYSQIVEAFLMKNAFKEGILIPNRPKQKDLEKRRKLPVYKGAIVIEPKMGIHQNILVFDFRSLYPTIIVTHNIDPWTKNCEHKRCSRNKAPETKTYFCTLKKGFIPKSLKTVIEQRKKVKKIMEKVGDEKKKKMMNEIQYSLKIIANATYGYYGYIGARWYCRECGEATAAFGRMYIKKVLEMAKKEGLEIIYGDTDSLMVRVPWIENREELVKFGKFFARNVTEKLPGIIELEFRGLYEGGIFVSRKKGEKGAKKRYALIDYKGNIEIRGFESVRRDWCELAKKIQRDVLRTILKEKDVGEAVKLVKETIERIKKGDVEVEEIVIKEQLTKPLTEYQQIGPHVKAAMKLKEAGIPVGEGRVIYFVITRGSGSISERAVPLELLKKKDFDPEYYIYHQILPASLRVLSAVGITKEDILSEGVQKNLKGFVGK